MLTAPHAKMTSLRADRKEVAPAMEISTPDATLLLSKMTRFASACWYTCNVESAIAAQRNEVSDELRVAVLGSIVRAISAYPSRLPLFRPAILLRPLFVSPFDTASENGS